MSHDLLKSEILGVLCRWNPIGVPDFIADDEYQAYVEPIISHLCDRKKLEAYMVYLAKDLMGLNLDTNNLNHIEDINRVVTELLDAIQKFEYKYNEVNEVEYKGNQFRIEKDHPEIGVYLYVYRNGECIKDYLQNDIQSCKKIAFEEFSVPIELWSERSK